MQGIPEGPHIWADLARAAILAVPAYILYLLDRRKRRAEIKREDAQAYSLNEAAEKSRQDRLGDSVDKLWLMHGRVEELCNKRDELQTKLSKSESKVRELEEENRRLKGNGRAH